MIWGPMIAIYLFLAGAAAGAYLTCSLISIKYPEDTVMRRIGRIIVPVLLAVGLLMLMLDAEAGLKNPLRFFGLVNNPRSVMTIGVYIICVFMPISLVVAFFELRGKKVPRGLDIVGDVFAVLLAGYTGVLLGVSMGVPLWNNPVLPFLFVVSALTSGMAMVVFIGTFWDREQYAHMTVLRPIHIVLAVLEAVLIAVFLGMAMAKGNAGAVSANMILTGSLAPAFWGGIVLLGLVLPLVIDVAVGRMSDHTSPRAMTTEAVGQVGVVVGGFALRMVVVLAGVSMILL